MKGISRAALAVAALALTTTSAAAITKLAASLTVDAHQTPQGASLSFKGKGFNANATILLTGTRAPTARDKQDFGKTKADDKGDFIYTKVASCTTTKMEDAQVPVTITATDSATNTAVSRKVEAGAWVCPE